MSNTEPDTVPVSLPTYVLFPVDGEVPLSMSPVSLVPVPPGFALIEPPGLLTEPPVAADTLPQDFAPPGSPVSLFSLGPLLSSLVQVWFSRSLG